MIVPAVINSSVTPVISSTGVTVMAGISSILTWVQLPPTTALVLVATRVHKTIILHPYGHPAVHQSVYVWSAKPLIVITGPGQWIP